MVTTQRTTQTGFTLIEILIAISIVGFLLAVLVPTIIRRGAAAEKQAAKTQMAQVKQSIDLYRLDVGRYPVKLLDLAKKPSDPKLASKWQGPYMDEDVLEDKWGQPYIYRLTPGGAHPYELYSLGPEGTEESKISAW